MKKTIKVNIKPEFQLVEDCSLATFSKLLRWVKLMEKQSPTEISIDFDYDYDDYRNVESVVITAMKEREETDEEYQNRLNYEKIRKEREAEFERNNQQREIKQLKRLKAKYPNI